MESFRHFVAAGVGAAIALSYMEPGAFEDVPLLAQSKTDRAENQDVQSRVAPTQGSLTESPQTKQKAVEPAYKGHNPTLATSASGVVPSLSSSSLVPQKAFTKNVNLGNSGFPLPIGGNGGWGIATDKSEGLNQDVLTQAPVIGQSLVDSLPDKFFAFSTTKAYSLGRLAELFTALAPTPNPQPLISLLLKPAKEDASIPLPTSSVELVAGLRFTGFLATPNPQNLTSSLVKPAKEEISSPVLTSSNDVIPDARLRLPNPVVSEVLARSGASEQSLDEVPKLTLPISSGGAALLSGVKRWKLSEYPTLATSQKVSEPAEEGTDKPLVSLGNTSLVQYPAILSAQSSEGNQQTSAPEFLNPSPNPLQFPTQSQEVQVRGTQPITLQQALELARRNNRDLQAAQITLERSQSALQEALAAEFPTASFSADFGRNSSGNQRLQN